ncbi:FAD-linked oxidoreductase-like protein [Rhodocollybia butyracea]|uniref:Proline dehydrogenase n=1 Tax=Rhodocollybia butyracea TaxID=206335 RepID=A0A9P5Q3C5_9AGAR|nr:FAD-linked oxidoreductase-like protein [Rhodocollybia butyracea]
MCTALPWLFNDLSATVQQFLAVSAFLGVGLGSVGLSTFFADRVIQADTNLAPDTSPRIIEPSSVPLGSLIRAYIVYSICSFPTFVDAAPKLLEVLMGIPIVRNITEALVRVTFFDQHFLRFELEIRAFYFGIASKLSSLKPSIKSIDVSAEFEDSIVGKESHSGRRTWVAIKMTALVPDAKSLVAMLSPEDLSILHEKEPVSKFLSSEDIASLRELYADLRRLCLRAQEKGVKLMIDAEHSRYQPAFDALQLALMREFNRIPPESEKSGTLVQPLIYGTFQAYLRRFGPYSIRRAPLYLAQSYRDAKANNYALGVKLRSATPVWVTKEETDKCYDECVKMVVSWIKEDVFPAQSVGWFSKKRSNDPRIGVLFGTHNWVSTKLILSELVRNGLATATSTQDEEGNAVLKLDNEVTERVTFGQLFGMRDALSNYIVRRTISNAPMVIKNVPYGTVPETMAYLGRRAMENKSVLGDDRAAEERKRVGRQIWAKFFG